MRTAFPLFAVALLAGCATPVGQIPESDFVRETNELAVGYQAAYRNIRDGFARCLDPQPQAELYTDIPEVRLVVYLGYGPGSIVVGTITLSEVSPTSSRVKVGVQKIFDESVFGPPGPPGRTLALWLDRAAGATRCD